MPPIDDRPYLYAPPKQQSATTPYHGFDPKAFTRATYAQAAQKPKPKQEGPLLNFNRHPDSYVVGVLPYGQTNVAPMHPRTKKTVKITRYIQLALRILQMLGALGMLVCVICIKNTQSADSYIIRAPPAADILATSYAIYHLLRAAKGRTPTSSASYHAFALVIDAGLIPFYIFTALLAKSELANSPHNSLRWQSFFDLAGTNKVILSTWLDAAVLAAFHLIECLISLSLVIMFRKIANMPPDMNPLEDNLTSRRKTKHKYKNSEISTASISAPLNDSTASFTKSSRLSPAKDGMTTKIQPISFLHTRNKSDYVYSPHNPNTANYSRSNVSIPNVPSMYSQPRSAQNSRVKLSKENLDISEPNYDRTETLKSDQTMMTSSSVYTIGSDVPHNTPPLPRKSSKRHSLLSDNWFVHRSDKDEDPAISVVEEIIEGTRGLSSKESASVFNFGHLKTNNRPYQPVRQHSDYNDDPRQRPPPPPKDDGFLVAPLGMNPPTPPPGISQNIPRGASRTPDRHPRPLGTSSGNANALSSRHITTPSPSPSKQRYYGDLDSAMAGIRSSPGASPRAHQPRPKSKYDSGIDGVAQDWRKGDGRDGPYAGIGRQDFAPGQNGNGGRRGGGGNARVGSSSGADIADERNARIYDYGDDGSNNYALRPDVRAAGLRGRNVSGKVAEEGRGGQWMSRWV